VGGQGVGGGVRSRAKGMDDASTGLVLLKGASVAQISFVIGVELNNTGLRS